MQDNKYRTRWNNPACISPFLYICICIAGVRYRCIQYYPCVNIWYIDIHKCMHTNHVLNTACTCMYKGWKPSSTMHSDHVDMESRMPMFLWCQKIPLTAGISNFRGCPFRCPIITSNVRPLIQIVQNGRHLIRGLADLISILANFWHHSPCNLKFPHLHACSSAYIVQNAWLKCDHCLTVHAYDGFVRKTIYIKSIHILYMHKYGSILVYKSIRNGHHIMQTEYRTFLCIHGIKHALYYILQTEWNSRVLARVWPRFTSFLQVPPKPTHHRLGWHNY